MSWIAVGSAAVSVGTSLLGGSSQRKSQRKAQQQQDAAYSRQQQVQAPYTTAGESALSQLQALNSGNYSGFESSPDYRYAKQEMTDSVDSNAAAQGTLYSGGHTVDLSRNINGLASQNLGNYRNSLTSIAQLGSNAASGTSQAAGQHGQNSSNLSLSAGDTNAQTIGAIGGGLQNLMGQYSQQPQQTQSQSTYAPNSSLYSLQASTGQGSNYNFGNNLSNFYGWR
jgi:hypothetical protein